MENHKFYILISSLSIFLLLLCLYGWHKVAAFTDAFEQSFLEAVEDVVEVSFEETERMQFEELAIEVAQKYAKFTSDDLDFSNLQSYFMEDSEILARLESYNSNRYNSHEGYAFQEMEIISCELIEENIVSCNITFDYIIFTGDSEYVYPSDYILSFDRSTQKIIGLVMNN